MKAKTTKAHLTLFLYLTLSLGYGVIIYGCIEGERKALLDFKEGLQDPGGRLSSWIGQDCCIWRGVHCDNQTGHVVQLDLGNKMPLHDMFGYGPHAPPLEGEIHPALLGLKQLQYLDLSMNFFGGIQIPAFFGSLKQLHYLDLSCAGFSGLVPHQLGNLSGLQHLDLSNPFYLPWNKLYMVGSHWLSNLSSLQYLNLNFVDISKAADWLESLNTLPLISEINLSNCTLELPLSLAHVNFSKLHFLDLSSNNLHSVVPPWLFKLRSLESLDLSVNAFKELVPSAIGNLTSLRDLNLANNGALEGGVPLSLGNLCMLKILDLSENRYLHGDLNELGEVFSGCMKDSLEIMSWVYSELKGAFPDWLGNLKSLKMLNLYYNSLSGPIPEFQLSSLKKLDISRNTLSGIIPKHFGELFPELVFLDLSWNNLTGVLTEEHFARLGNLEHLGLASNAFHFDVRSEWVPPLNLKKFLVANIELGPKFPVWLQKLEKLTHLHMSNARISDELPDWIWNFSSNVQFLDLSYNDIKGELPTSLEHPNLVYIDLSGNHFEGSIPKFSAKLQDLLLLSNNITGSIPKQLCELLNLKVLDLSKNQITGEIPDCWNTPLHSKLFAMDLSSNNLSGKIPTSICSQPLTYLHLGNNDLSGELPLSLRNCRTLTTLDLGQNRISGKIPTWLAENLLNLQTLRLRSNMLIGDIPSNLGSLISLRVIDFANNHLSGTIPSSLGNLSATKIAHKIFDNKKVALMAYDKISTGYIDNNELLYMVSSKLLLGYMDNIKVNLKGRDVRYDKLLPLLIFIDLSSNELSGEIPEELVNLLYLQSLNLSRNHFTGRMPENINMLRWLESLDLSMNNFSGPIPSTMTMLSLLSHLNLSYNNFFGRIPYGGQLLSLPDPSIYFGNHDLCGFPLDKKCEASQHANKNGGIFTEDEKDMETTWLFLSIVVGFISGCWIIWGTLLLNNKWRFALFNFVDDICDVIYFFYGHKIRKKRNKHFG